MTSNALDLVQPISGKHKSTERDTTTNGACASARDCDWNAILCSTTEKLCDLFSCLGKYDTLSRTAAHEARVGKVILDFVSVGFNQHVQNVRHTSVCRDSLADSSFD
jgi:hypothetical protein